MPNINSDKQAQTVLILFSVDCFFVIWLRITSMSQWHFVSRSMEIYEKGQKLKKWISRKESILFIMGGSRIFCWGGPHIEKARDARQNVPPPLEPPLSSIIVSFLSKSLDRLTNL